MLTIAGNGMGPYSFENLNLDIDSFDTIVCDPNFEESSERILKLRYREAKEYILRNYDKEEILYVVTGSPLFYSAGTIVAKLLPRESVTIVDGESSLGYLCRKLAISMADVQSISLHARERPDPSLLLKRRYTFILCDAHSVRKIAKALEHLKRDDISVTIAYKLGYEDEYIGEFDLYGRCEFDLGEPYVLLIERLFGRESTIAEDSSFVTERGMISKKYKRELSLQHLDLEEGMTLWDIGAGSGSCAISAYLRYGVATVLFEKNPRRAAYIEENLARKRVLCSELLVGDAVEHWRERVERPERIFVGGGGARVLALLPELYDILADSGIMLVAVVTLDSLVAAISSLEESAIEYEAISLSFTKYSGKLMMAEPQREIFWIKVRK